MSYKYDVLRYTNMWGTHATVTCCRCGQKEENSFRPDEFGFPWQMEDRLRMFCELWAGHHEVFCP